MPTTYKVLGQSYPTAATATTLYTVPSSTSAIVSTITGTNLSVNSDELSIAIRPAGETLANKHYILNGENISGNANISITIGITLATTDVITVTSKNGTSAFSAFGSEIS